MFPVEPIPMARLPRRGDPPVFFGPINLVPSRPRILPTLIRLDAPIPLLLPPRVIPVADPEACPGERVIDLPEASALADDDVMLLDSPDRGTRQTTLEALRDFVEPVVLPATERITLNFTLTPDGWFARFPLPGPSMIQIVFSDGAYEAIVLAPIRRQGGETFVYVQADLPPIAYAEIVR
jgi:hypothetical protein